MTSNDAVEDAQQMKRELLEQLEKLAEDLPPNTLDELIDELGGPENVAEVGFHVVQSHYTEGFHFVFQSKWHPYAYINPLYNLHNLCVFR